MHAPSSRACKEGSEGEGRGEGGVWKNLREKEGNGVTQRGILAEFLVFMMIAPNSRTHKREGGGGGEC